MSIYELTQKLSTGEVAGWAVVLIVIFLSLVQISPVKLNPWDRILSWFGRKMNGPTEDRLKAVETQIRDMWINNHRQSILTFARECRADIGHSSDEWSNVLNIAEEYEKYVTDNHITNGIITQDTEYLRNLYQELSREHKI
ncbi:MAG: hypothetical protein IJV41_05235 [Oscillospiraceae bacterium]|nr:hypothetical protein [Oscillospiraceae bacterium]